MKKLFLWCGYFGLTAALLTGCAKKNPPIIIGEFTGMEEGILYISYAPAAAVDSVCEDTVQVKHGRFVYDRKFSEPMEIQIEVEKDRKIDARGRVQVPLSYSLCFLWMPGEEVRLKGVYENNYLLHKLEGSESLKAQTQQRKAVKEISKKADEVMVEINRLSAKSEAEIDEHVMDSLSEFYVRLRDSITSSFLPYVKAHPDQTLSAFFFLQQRKPEVVLEYFPLLSETLRSGILKERLSAHKQKAERRKQIEKNAETVVEGAIAPDFSISDIEGKLVSLSELKGKYIVLDFWGTWCSWCIKGIPAMKKYATQYKNKVVFVSIACRDKTERVKQIVEAEGMTWLQLINGEGGSDVAFIYGIMGYPSKIILDPNLKVVGRYLGEGPEFYEKLDHIL